jgi:hypothetical protein
LLLVLATTLPVPLMLAAIGPRLGVVVCTSTGRGAVSRATVA